MLFPIIQHPLITYNSEMRDILMSDIYEQLVETSKLAEFLRDDAGSLVNANELAALTNAVEEGWELGSKVTQLRKEGEIQSNLVERLIALLRKQETLVAEISKNHDQNLGIVNHLTRFSHNLHRMVREISYIEDAEDRGDLFLKKKTGYMIDETMYHNAMREVAILFNKSGDSRSSELPICPFGALILQLGYLLGLIATHLQVNVLYRVMPQILNGLLSLREDLARQFRPIYWNVKHKYFQEDLKKNLVLLESFSLMSDSRGEQLIKVKGLKKNKELAEILKILENLLDRESQNKQMPSMEMPLPELK
ncbi:MAG: hypothetical protein RBG13Loki_0449 [Promethearchaeota archaeon CR_4]|nr:MAG: hypothetical protein RBG13Loki_0449 [Candidatus Lokiarchaeota archaeon CR_4]